MHIKFFPHPPDYVPLQLMCECMIDHEIRTYNEWMNEWMNEYTWTQSRIAEPCQLYSIETLWITLGQTLTLRLLTLPSKLIGSTGLQWPMAPLKRWAAVSCRATTTRARSSAWRGTGVGAMAQILLRCRRSHCRDELGVTEYCCKMGHTSNNSSHCIYMHHTCQACLHPLSKQCDPKGV